MAGVAKFLEGGAFGVLNDVLSIFRSNEGYAQPNRYEVLIYPPIGQQLGNVHGGGLQNKRMLEQLTLRCESVNLPGRNIATSDDTNIYGPVRQVAEGVTYAEDLSLSFVSSGGLEERVFFEEWQKLAFNEETWNTWTNLIKNKTGLKGKDLFMPLRIALTGKDKGPELKYLLPLLNKKIILKKFGKI